jgi:hypothetical protein
MNKQDFQTPKVICKYMVSLLEKQEYDIILEPTPGEGNLANAAWEKGTVMSPHDFFELKYQRFDAVVMNPPFTPMALGYKILFSCLDMSDEIVALMPWLTLINSQKRADKLFAFGLKSVTHLPRTVFPGSRVQCCVLHLLKGYSKETVFVNYSSISSPNSPSV